MTPSSFTVLTSGNAKGFIAYKQSSEPFLFTTVGYSQSGSVREPWVIQMGQSEKVYKGVSVFYSCHTTSANVVCRCRSPNDAIRNTSYDEFSVYPHQPRLARACPPCHKPRHQVRHERARLVYCISHPLCDPCAHVCFKLKGEVKAVT